jgi:hypothetical protein
MKVILTENQLKQIIFESLIEEAVVSELNESFNFDILKTKIKKAMIAGVALSTILFAINKLHINTIEKQHLIELAKSEAEKHKQDRLFDVKVQACKQYMEFALNNKNKTLDDTKLKPETLVKCADEMNIDLPFLMAVAHQESCFGSTNRALRTNSVFSVGSYDNGKDYATYSDPNESVAPYIRLLKRDYLVNGKTIHDLLKPGMFVNHNGDRYASDKNYENSITYLRNLIIKKFPELQ